MPQSRDEVQHGERGTLEAEPYSKQGAWTVPVGGLALELGVQFSGQNEGPG